MTVVSLPEPATAQAPEPEPDPEPAPPSTEPVPIEPELNDPPASPPAPPEIPEPEPPQALDPEPEPEPPVQPEPAPSVNEPPATEGPLMVYGDDFPHPEEAEGGCFGFSACRRVSGAGTYRSVARSLIANLENQGYEVSLRDDLEDTGRNVYELSPPDAGAATQYLMVFSDHDGSAIYVMSDQILTLNELRTMQA